MNVECIDFPDLGMEAVWTIGVENFRAFVLVDDKGNDFFNELGLKFAGSVRASVVSLRDACAKRKISRSCDLHQHRTV